MVVRDEPEGIVLHDLRHACATNLVRRGVRESMIAALLAYPFPGNVRELENLARRLAALYPQDIITGPVIDCELASPAVASGIGGHSINGLSGAVEMHLSSLFASFPNGLPPPGLYHRVLREIEVPLLTLDSQRSIIDSAERLRRRCSIPATTKAGRTCCSNGATA